MTNHDSTYIAVVLDRSGSMDSVKQATIDGFNEFLHQQKLQPGTARLYLAQFDDQYDVLYDRPLNEAEKLNTYTYSPRGMTALYDAIGKTISDLGKKLKETPEFDRPAKVLVAIITDGHENHSREFTQRQIADMVQHQKDKYAWDFVFIGANQDAVMTAKTFNISQDSALTYNSTSSGVQGMSVSLGNYTNAVRSSSAGGASASFSKADRKRAMAA